jgi:Tfp pilus assembly protein FimT
MRQKEDTRTSSRRGFTILELMMAVALCFTIYALALPQIKSFLVRSDLQASTEDTFDLVRFAQVHSAMRSRAHGLYGETGGTGDNGKLWLVEGTNSSCMSLLDPLAVVIRTVDFNMLHPSVEVEEIQPENLNLAKKGICFKPSGRIVRADTGAPIPSKNPELGAGEVEIVLVQKVHSRGTLVTHLPRHRITIGYNGDVQLKF